MCIYIYLSNHRIYSLWTICCIGREIRKRLYWDFDDSRPVYSAETYRENRVTHPKTKISMGINGRINLFFMEQRWNHLRLPAPFSGCNFGPSKPWMKRAGTLICMICQSYFFKESVDYRIINFSSKPKRSMVLEYSPTFTQFFVGSVL